MPFSSYQELKQWEEEQGRQDLASIRRVLDRQRPSAGAVVKRILQLALIGFIVWLFVSLVFSMPARADTLEVSFTAAFESAPLGPGTVTGAFLWNTSNEKLSKPNITDTTGETFPTLLFASFAGVADSSGYPAGSLKGFMFLSPDGNRIQLDYGAHAFLNPPLLPQAGSYSANGLFFWDNDISLDASITVSDPPVSTAEPTSLVKLAAVAGLYFVLLAGYKGGKNVRLY